MSPDMLISPEPLTREAFRPFGQVIQLAGLGGELINDGNTEKFANLAKLVAANDGRMALHLYRSKPAELPISIRVMERHLLGSQAFFPLHKRPFPIVVALPGTAPGAGDVRVFLSNGRQGVNLDPGVWHHYQLSLEQASDYLVIDRAGNGANFEETRLEQAVVLQI